MLIGFSKNDSSVLRPSIVLAFAPECRLDVNIFKSHMRFNHGFVVRNYIGGVFQTSL